ncbi:MAG: molybdenum cofactor biosysynthesis protein [Candidatus Eisenbacteria bacterium]|uniref:Molybdenum cofactor biosysynthesis protein n=1 Tax=Eiseniibacteriota bacterium TaxID=2212470 RepID=A0A956NAJ6_UNCEI|nr:molybdenum cofactor biosysynthesis protein [Candidatus Eisenbacteria bacterium]
MNVRNLFISPGHNFVGHHGGPPGQHEIFSVDRVDCVHRRGLRGDRYFERPPDHKGQITFFSQEVLDELSAALGISELPASAVRRNVIVSGVQLNGLIGTEFEVQGVRFLGVEECRPCYWMDHAVGPGAEDLLRGRGGLRCRILTDGELYVGEGLLRVTVRPEEASTLGNFRHSMHALDAR